MTDYADLKKRLRERADTIHRIVVMEDERCWIDHETGERFIALDREAADAISALTKQVEERDGFVRQASALAVDKAMGVLAVKAPEVGRIILGHINFQDAAISSLKAGGQAFYDELLWLRGEVSAIAERREDADMAEAIVALALRLSRASDAENSGS